MDQLTLNAVHRRIVALEEKRMALISDRCRWIAREPVTRLEACSAHAFQEAMNQMEGELERLWREKRTLIAAQKMSFEMSLKTPGSRYFPALSAVFQMPISRME